MVGWHRWLSGHLFVQIAIPEIVKDRKAWRAAVHRLQSIGQELVTEQQQHKETQTVLISYSSIIFFFNVQIFLSSKNNNSKIINGIINIMVFPGAASGKEPTCQCRRHKRRGFDYWIRKFPWRRAWQLIPVLPGEPHGQRSLWATVHGVANSQTQLTHSSLHKINLNKYIFFPTNNKYFWKSDKWKVLLFIILICLPIMNHIRYFIIHLKITYTFLYIKLSYSLPIFNWFLSYFLIDFQKTWLSFKYIVWVCHFFYMNYSEFLTTLKK